MRRTGTRPALAGRVFARAPCAFGPRRATPIAGAAQEREGIRGTGRPVEQRDRAASEGRA